MRYFHLYLVIILITWLGQSQAQNVVPTFKASKKTNINRLQADDLARSFERYTLWEIDHKAVYEFARQQKDFIHFQLDLGDLKIDLPLEKNSLRKADCTIVFASNAHEKVENDLPIYTYKGRTDLGLDQQIRMTIHEDYISAFLLIDGEEYYLEPASRFASLGDYVWYSRRSVVNFQTAVCGMVSGSTKQPLSTQAVARTTCLKAELAIATDYSYYIDHGSNYTQVITDLEEVFNIVDGIYQTNLDIDLQVVTYFISDCSTCDPWTTSTDPSSLLASFRSWGNAGGFLTSAYDVASFWTDRDLDSSVVGIAYLWTTSICGTYRYNVNQDYAFNLNKLKTLWAHELGHNFGSDHDPDLGCSSGYIMAPSVDPIATSFSSCSIAAIDSYVSGLSCLDACSNSCPTDEFVTAPLSSTHKVEVSNQITANNDVLSTANVIYDAGYEVDLLAGFDAQAGCDFLAVIDGCGGSYKTTDAPRIVLQPQTDAMISALKCFPNPFNESTTLSYTLVKDQSISLSIFNANGQEIVRLLENVAQIAGNHEVTFDGQNLPNGLYFYHFIDGEGNVLTGKMSKF